MMRAMFASVALIAMPLAAPGAAQDSMPPAPYAYKQLEDPVLEAQAKELMATLRCLTCQSQTIADSDAPMAGDMRHQVRSRIAAGQSPAQVREWLRASYGDYVSYEPEVSATTWPLFLIPLVFLFTVGLILWRRLRRGSGPEGDQA